MKTYFKTLFAAAVVIIFTGGAVLAQTEEAKAVKEQNKNQVATAAKEQNKNQVATAAKEQSKNQNRYRVNEQQQAMVQEMPSQSAVHRRDGDGESDSVPGRHRVL